MAALQASWLISHLESLVAKEVDFVEAICLHKLQAVCLVPALQGRNFYVNASRSQGNCLPRCAQM